MELEIPNLDNPQERKKLVKMLSIFRKIRKISRTRALQLFHRVQNGVREAIIMTGQEIETGEQKYLLSLYKKSFPDAPKPSFTLNEKLLGGVRMSYGDEMVELSLNQLRIKN